MESNKRIIGLDIARAFAIFGMMCVNYKVIFNQDLVKYASVKSILALLEGRAAAVFLILAGIGIGLMTQKGYVSNNKKLRKRNQAIILKRVLFLFVIGFAFYFLWGWDADILHYYGVYMLLIIPLLYGSKKQLINVFLMVMVFSFLMQILLNYESGWDFSTLKYLDINSGLGFIRNTFFNGFHPVFPWFAFMIIGLLISRYNIRDLKVQKMSFKIGLLLASITEVLSFLLLVIFKHTEVAVYFFDTKPMNPSVLYVIASSGWAIAFISIMLILSSRYTENKVLDICAKTGQLALSHYIAHFTIVLAAFDLFDGLAYKNEIFVVVLSIVVFIGMIIFSNIWLKHFKRGPLEWMMRSLCG